MAATSSTVSHEGHGGHSSAASRSFADAAPDIENAASDSPTGLTGSPGERRCADVEQWLSNRENQ